MGLHCAHRDSIVAREIGQILVAKHMTTNFIAKSKAKCIWAISTHTGSMLQQGFDTGSVSLHTRYMQGRNLVKCDQVNTGSLKTQTHKYTFHLISDFHERCSHSALHIIHDS